MMFSCSEEDPHALEGVWSYNETETNLDADGNTITTTVGVTVTFTAATVTWETLIQAGDDAISCSATGSWTEVVENNINAITFVFPDSDDEEIPCPSGEAEGTYVIDGATVVFTLSDADGSSTVIILTKE